MKKAKTAVVVLIIVTLISIMLPQPAEAARRYKAGDWLTKEEFFELYGLEKFIDWGMAGGSVGGAIGDSETDLYPIKVKATLVDVSIGSIAVLAHRINLPDSFQQTLSQRGEQVLLSSKPITLRFNESESGVSTEYGSFSYNYQLTLQDLTYSYSRGFSSLSSPFTVSFTAKGDAKVSGHHRNLASDETFIEEQYHHILSETEFKERMQCAIDETGNMMLTAVFAMKNAVEAETYNSSNVRVKFRVDEVQLGKLSDGDGWISLSSGGSDSPRNDEPTGPLTTVTISILAILLSILFGNTGGFIPTVPVGAGGAPAPMPTGTGGAPGLTPAGDGLSRWLRFDGDGDIEATDPVNGQKRTYVKNGDGTYTNPVSGATYTPEELSEQLEHRAGNADTIRQDEAQFRQNVSEDRQRNQERSEESLQLEEDLQRERQERARKEKIERIATELGMSGASEKEVRAELERRLERDEEYRQKMHEYAQRRDMAVDVLEATVDMADYAMSAGEALVPGGKVVSATYKGIKNIGSTVAEKGLSTGTVIEGAIKGGTEAATTMMDAGIGKAVTTMGGTVAGEIAGAVNDGEDITRATAEGLAKGAVNAAVGAVSDGVEDAASSLSGKAATKVTETALGKEVVDPILDEAFKKDK
jgi:hypothetical protein